ncbi:putative SGNH hydrolase-type esterase domain-containing protein [Rosa chinensis]|uniref:Putative SGNH hydrolase-type esterase domain-containing protein n=1 Tax=Rosa chinensis TaxID=74649 RepID=A0A2P6PT39_ROSCH|nr:putative SGNH hydrolase-type esterase domain-containing protein [Rosa chinensis]
MAKMGAAATEKFLSKSLIFTSSGSNDLFGYYHSNSSIPKEEFLSSLGLAYENHLKLTYLCYSTLSNFTQVEDACCGAGKLGGESFCTPDDNLCSNRDQYLF